MRKIQLFVLSVVVVLFTACHGNLWDAIEDLDARVARLEELCKEMNTNITSLQTIVSVIQENDVITGITPIEKGGKVVGYTISFDKHDPITIYNGEDGKDGANGTNGIDGKDGYTPILGVAKDTDGVYYWTLDGEWLLDAEGNKLRVTGRDGKDGVDGEDGKDGVDGEDGKDGVDGEDGKDGQDGKSAYQIWLDNGNTGTQADFLNWLKGQDGKDGADGTVSFDELTDAQKAALLQELDPVSQELQCDVVIVTMQSCGGYNPDTVIDQLYDQYNYGYGSTRDGVVLLLSSGMAPAYSAVVYHLNRKIGGVK